MKLLLPLFLICTFYSNGESYAQSWLQKAKEKTKQTWEKTKEATKQTWEISKETREEVTEQVRGTLRELDYKKIKEFKENGKKYLRSSAIRGIKNIPVCDQNSGRMITFDEYCRNVIYQVGGSGLQGSDIAEDPVETAVMIMMDNNQLYEAKIIKNKQGNWTSIKEASISGTHGDIVAEFWNMKNAYKRYDYIGFSNSFVSMMNKVEKVNQ